MRRTLLLIIIIFAGLEQSAQYTLGDSLRGTLNEDRTWWDVDYYDLKVKLDIENKSLSGSNTIKFRVLRNANLMQIDLQSPLHIDSVISHGQKCKWTQRYDAWKIQIPEVIPQQDSITIYYSGKPKSARFAPWDGGLVWSKDDKKRPWIGVACQGLGASVWWPNKDHQSDEPDKGMRISVRIPDTLVNISNGQLVNTVKHPDHTCTWIYEVKNPINNYDVTMNIGKYITETEFYEGKNGPLKIEYCMLDYHRDKIATHLRKDAINMLKCFEYWFGPYPFYEDGYRLVETSYLGMEHQSAIAYGNNFKQGYLGRDLSQTGIGLSFDFIIVHESGHEWFGNNITTRDMADAWVHEGFTTYAEALFIECTMNKDSAAKYVQGQTKKILNDKAVIGDYGVNREGSGDKYNKGAIMIHMIRQIMENDSLFHNLLVGMNQVFRKKMVDGKQIEDYMINISGKDLAPVFDQYLRSNKVPQLEYKLSKNKLYCRYVNCNENFKMPLKVLLDGKSRWIYPDTRQKVEAIGFRAKKLEIDKNFYVRTLLLK